MFRKLDLFLSSGEGRETPAILYLLEETDLNQLKTETGPVVFFLILDNGWGP
jgi:hypothetical protein